MPAPTTATEALQYGHELQGLKLAGHASILTAPAHRSNYSTPRINPWRGATRTNLAICYHTPEEPIDDNEVTPRWFANPNANASTHFYVDSDGDLYQMVSLQDFAWAQGVRFEPTSTRQANAVTPYPKWFDLNKHKSYNTCMISMEIEGYAATHERHFYRGTPQWDTTVKLSAYLSDWFSIPVNATHHLGHQHLCTTKRDPGWSLEHWQRLLTDIEDCRINKAYTSVQTSADYTELARKVEQLSDEVASLRQALNEAAAALAPRKAD